jgi:AcrR family transcriptional regulator
VLPSGVPPSRNSPGPRAPRTDALRNAERILAVAREVLGQADVSLEEIARRAGVGPATLYRHYPSKDDLVAAVISARYAERVAPILDEADADPDALRGLLRALEAALEIRAQHMRVARRLVGTADELARDYFRRLGVVLARAQAQGTVRPDLTMADLPRLMAMVGGTMAFDDGDGWRRYLVLLTDLLRSRPSQPLPQLRGGYPD